MIFTNEVFSYKGFPKTYVIRLNVIVWNLIDPKATSIILPTFLAILYGLFQMSNDQ